MSLQEILAATVPSKKKDKHMGTDQIWGPGIYKRHNRDQDLMRAKMQQLEFLVIIEKWLKR